MPNRYLRRLTTIGALMIPLLCMAQSAHAAGSSSAGVVNIWYVDSAGNVTFSTTGTRANLPSCALTDWWTFNGSTDGAALASTLLSAMMSNRAFSVMGTGTCDANGRELVAYIEYIF